MWTYTFSLFLFRMCWVHHVTGVWVYPLLEHLGTMSKVLFFFSLIILITVYYILGEILNSYIWDFTTKSKSVWISISTCPTWNKNIYHCYTNCGMIDDDSVAQQNKLENMIPKELIVNECSITYVFDWSQFSWLLICFDDNMSWLLIAITYFLKWKPRSPKSLSGPV